MQLSTQNEMPQRAGSLKYKGSSWEAGRTDCFVFFFFISFSLFLIDGISLLLKGVTARMGHWQKEGMAQCRNGSAFPAEYCRLDKMMGKVIHWLRGFPQKGHATGYCDWEEHRLCYCSQEAFLLPPTNWAFLQAQLESQGCSLQLGCWRALGGAYCTGTTGEHEPVPSSPEVKTGNIWRGRSLWEFSSHQPTVEGRECECSEGRGEKSTGGYQTVLNMHGCQKCCNARGAELIMISNIL